MEYCLAEVCYYIKHFVMLLVCYLFIVEQVHIFFFGYNNTITYRFKQELYLNISINVIICDLILNTGLNFVLSHKEVYKSILSHLIAVLPI